MESEEVDEINEAYADILEELGNYVKNSFCSRYIYLAGYAKTVEDNFEEGMPSLLLTICRPNWVAGGINNAQFQCFYLIF